MDGVTYLMNKIGQALAAAEQRIAELEAENEQLRAAPPAGEPAKAPATL